MDEDAIIKGIKEWYSRDEVLYEMIKLLKGRETAFMGIKFPVRHIKAHSVDYLKSNFEAFRFFDKAYNIYGSLGYYNDLPMFSYNIEERKQQQEDFIKNGLCKQHLIGYDCGIDFDSKSKPKEAFIDFKSIIDLFDDWKIPYTAKVSGRGFHIVIPDKYLPNLHIEDKVAWIRKFVRYLKYVEVNPTIDDDIYNLDRLWKVPYSFDIKSGNVALPLSSHQIANFDYSMMRYDQIGKIRNRGEILFHEDSNAFEEFINAGTNMVWGG